jgi:hypothetical protein
MSISVSPFNPVQQAGCRAKNPPDLVIASRAPTTLDYGYFLGTFWLFVATGLYVLASRTITPTLSSATWLALESSGSGVFTSLTVTGPVALNDTGAATTNIGTGGTGAVAIGNTTGNTVVTGNETITGNLSLTGVGSKISINASAPATASVGTTVAMTAGAVTTASTAVTTASLIQYSRRVLGGTAGNVSITAQSAGSFTLTSSSGTDTSTYNYEIIN